MEPGQKVELHIPSLLGFEKVAMDSVASVAKKMGFSPDRIDDLKTAVGEACSNAIRHGTGEDAAAKIGVTLTAGESGLHVDVHDDGEGVGEVATPNIDDKMNGKGHKVGWGVFLIRKLMDDVQFVKKPEGGNVVKMVIYLE